MEVWVCYKRKRKIKTTKSDSGEFLSRKVCYENLNLEKPVPGYILHLQDNTLELSCFSLGSGRRVGHFNPEMCLSSPFVKASLEISPCSLSSSSRVSGGRGLSRSVGISGIPAKVPSQHLQVPWASWITGAVFVSCILSAVSLSYILTSYQMPAWHIPHSWWNTAKTR